MSDVQIGECNRDNPCVTCDDDKCLHKGKIECDCPKWKCDNDPYGDCWHCEFIMNYLKAEYGVDMEQLKEHSNE